VASLRATISIAGVLGIFSALPMTAPSTAQSFGQRLSVEISGGTTQTGETLKSSTPQIGGVIYAPLHTDPVGKPCLSVAPFAQPQTLNKSIFDQSLMLDNHCGKQIRIRACYYNTSNCLDFEVGGYQRKRQILGIFPSKDFRFSYREYVN